jgi:tetratricopeptide (TPR) repeat protein
MKIKMVKRLIYIFAFLMISAASLYPVPKEIEDALKLNRINHFDEALEIIERALEEEKIKPDITSAYTVGRILYRKGEFYREAAKLSVLKNIEYLEHIKEKESVLPDEIKLFLGINYFFADRYLEGAGLLSQVVEKRAVDDNLYGLALVYLGASYHQTGEKERAFDLWEKVGNDSPLAYSTLGYIYAYLRINPSEGERITKEVLEFSKGPRVKNIDTLRINYAYTLLSMQSFSEAYREISDIDLDTPIHIFMQDPNKEIRFYDPAILTSYSEILFGESIKNLEPIVTASSGELASFASYYVAQMYLYLGDYDKSLKFALRAKKLSVASSLTMVRAVACEASANIFIGKTNRGLRLLRKEVDRIYGKPSSLLEMTKVVISSDVDKESVGDLVKEIEAYVYETEWKRSRRDIALLGEVSFFSGYYTKALYYLESARDKGNKNKIETNDPNFLLKLSYVYYMKEFYPESLEILFSLGSRFSGIRPLQDAVQSVYSYQQRGSGEILID